MIATISLFFTRRLKTHQTFISVFILLYTFILTMWVPVLHASTQQSSFSTCPLSQPHNLEISCFSPSIQPLATKVKNLILTNDSKKLNDIESLNAAQLLNELTHSIESLPRGYHNELFYLSGLIAENQGDSSTAESNYRRSIAIQHNNPLVLRRLALLLGNAKRYDEATAILKEALWLSPGIPPVLLNDIGQMLLHSNKPQLGLPFLQQAVTLNTHPALEARRTLAKCQTQLLSHTLSPARSQALHQRLIDNLRTIVLNDPQDRQSTVALIRALIQKSDPLLQADNLHTAETLARSLADSTSYKDAEAVRLLFDTLINRHNLDEAETALAAGLKLNPKNALLLAARKQLSLERKADLVTQERTSVQP